MGPILTLEDALHWRMALRAARRTLALTNGHFDLLHVGHLDYLVFARAQAGALLVGVNDDASTTLLKGPGRPLVPAAERARLLAALHPVDAVVIFGGPTAAPLVRALAPDVYVKGGDYATKPLPERDVVAQMGGVVVLAELVPERSTSALIARIRALPPA